MSSGKSALVESSGNSTSFTTLRGEWLDFKDNFGCSHAGQNILIPASGARFLIFLASLKALRVRRLEKLLQLAGLYLVSKSFTISLSSVKALTFELKQKI